MPNKMNFAQHLFHPLAPIILYLFMGITTLHLGVPLLLAIHSESLVFLLAIGLTLISIYKVEQPKMDYAHPLVLPILLGIFISLTPILSSFFNQDFELNLFQNDEYKDLIKMTLFGPCLYFMMQNNSYRRLILDAIILFYSVFGFIFLYRYLILNEVRDFDLRPLLKIRHGDANFLCTFFSMMTPFPLMRVYEKYQKQKKIVFSWYIMASLLFMTCAALTESRMGLISLFLGLFYLITKKEIAIPKKWPALIFFLLCSFVLAAGLGDRILSRYAELQDKSNTDRYLTWKNGLKVFSDNPVVGAGMYKAKDFFFKNTEYPDFQSEFNPLEVHNTLLQIGSELGLMGIISFSLFFTWVIKRAMKAPAPVNYFLLTSIGILTLSTMTIGVAYKDLFLLHFFVIAGLGTSGDQQHE